MDQLDASRDPVHRAEPASRKFKPEKYSGAIDGNIDSWLAMMRIHMDQEASLPESDKILKVVNFLAKEARTFLLNKPLEDRDTVDKIFELLSRRFGTGTTLNHARAAFNSRKQRPQESFSAFLGNLGGLRLTSIPSGAKG